MYVHLTMCLTGAFRLAVVQTTSVSGYNLRAAGACTLLLFSCYYYPQPNISNHCYVVVIAQIVTYSGFYDDNLEWVGLEGVQLVGSMNPGSSMGRHLLTTRFTSIVRIACIR